MADSAEKVVEVEAFDAEKFIFDVPLYENKIVRVLTELDPLYKKGPIRFKGHCYYCKENSIFTVTTNYAQSMIRNNINSINRDYGGEKIVQVECAIDPKHIISMYLQCYQEGKVFSLQKIGQFPSHADITNAKIKEYASVLETQDRSEIIRANGLAAHGVHIGAFVYIRRVIARLVYRHYERSKLTEPNKEEFQKLRMQEKIVALRDFLPPFMVENKNIYGIISKGIHQLSEDECGHYYEILMTSVFLILDEEKIEVEKEKKVAMAAKALSKISSSLRADSETK